MAKNKNLIRIFEYALNQEKAGQGFFENSLKNMGTGAAKNAFKRLAQEEEKHIEIISRILKGLKDGAELEFSHVEDVKLEKGDFFDKKARKAFLRACEKGSNLPDLCAFNVAWLMEKDISDYYSRMAEQARGEAKKAFLMLAQWEEGHATFFKEFKDKLNEIYSKVY
jgi:rubrerythrin